MHSRLSDVPAAIRLSRSTLKNIHENLFWAFFYNVIGIPLAAGLWYPLLGLKLSPMFGAAAMSLSSFCVVSNALRLNLFKLHDAGKDKKLSRLHTGPLLPEISISPDDAEPIDDEIIEEDETMEKTMKIEGMMCPHCSGRVKQVLEALAEVDEAIVSHENGTAILTLTKDVDNAVLTKAIEDQDYKVLSIE